VPGTVVVGSLVVESPMIETPFPLSVTGTSSPIGSCVPESTPPRPLVTSPSKPPLSPGTPDPPDSPTVVAAPEASLSPSPLIALPETVAGTSSPRMPWVPPRIPSRPEVVAGSAAEVPAASVSPTVVDGAEVCESPRPLIALPETVTGTSPPSTACVPPRMPSRPEVDGAVAVVPAPASVPLVPEFPEVEAGPTLVEGDEVCESPISEIPLPETVTGTSTPSSPCVPLATPSAPDVAAGSAAVAPAASASPTVVDGEEVCESPRSLIALPETVTGTSPPSAACVPPRIPWEPEVDAAGVLAVPLLALLLLALLLLALLLLALPLPASADVLEAAGASDVVAACDECDEPTTETELPETVTGTCTPRSAWVPEISPPSPEVEAGCEAGAGAESDAVLACDDCESPRRLTALPDTVTGALDCVSTWVPDAAAPDPSVVAAFAAVVPRAQRPPAKRTPQRVFHTMGFMAVRLS